MKNNKSGFTLIELLIVIGIIAILAVSIIIAINPGQQFAQARDATRQGHINSLNQAILSYMVSNHGDLSGLNIPPTPTEICAVTSTCEGLVNLEPLLTGGHLSAIPIDPSGGTLTNGSGYRIFTYGSDPAIHASKAETRAIQIGNWSFTDPRDGNAYKTVLIGDQLWMAENLNHDNGCTEVVWENGIDKGWCGLPQLPDDCTLGVDCIPQEGYGLLYQWSAAMNVCPARLALANR
jgi:prepilin-type N-terminal cleavage/methylation domain-containing protein